MAWTGLSGTSLLYAERDRQVYTMAGAESKPLDHIKSRKLHYFSHVTLIYTANLRFAPTAL